MGHPDIKNETPFAFELSAALDEQGRELVVALVKATFTIATNGDVALADEQTPLLLGGQPWGEPDKHGYKFEPEGSFYKPATDVVLVGHSQPPAGNARAFDVALRVAGITKSLRIFGDRMWYRGASGPAASEPRPCEPIPLSYDRAFGGWDRSSPDKTKHAYEPRNPIGKAFRARGAQLVEGVQLPNIEDPVALVTKFDSQARPVGVGFTSPEWSPRAEYAGTYDEAWKKTRMPFLPADFDRRFFNAASEGLVLPGQLRGGEPMFVSNVMGLNTASFALPQLVPPVCLISPLRGRDFVLNTTLDTVIVFSDEQKLLMIWRAHAALPHGPHSVRDVVISCSNAPRRPTIVRPLPSNVIPLRPVMP